MAKSVLEAWRGARPLEGAEREAALALASGPEAEFRAALPVPPGINQWWEPVSVHRGGRTVASLRLSAAARDYTQGVGGLLLASGLGREALRAAFAGLWLEVEVVSYLATPLQRDADGPVKVLQDLFCKELGVDDARVRRSAGLLRLDPEDPRAEIALRGYRLWDASGGDGPYYRLREAARAGGGRTEPRLARPADLGPPRPCARFAPELPRRAGGAR